MFDWFRNMQFDLFLLQETHSVKESERIWASEWGFKCYFSHGTSCSAGVCILFKSNSNLKFSSIHRDDQGRILLLNVMHDNTNFYCC